MVGLLDGVARAAQIGRQPSDGGEARAGGVGAALDVLPQLGLQLAVEGGVALLVQVHGASRLRIASWRDREHSDLLRRFFIS